MLCSNCGANVPMAGKVCPLCHADKSRDQLVHSFGIFGAVACGGIGWLMSPPCAGPFFGVIIGMVLGMVIGSFAKIER